MTKTNACLKLNVPDVVSSLMHAEDVMKVEADDEYCSVRSSLFSVLPITKSTFH